MAITEALGELSGSLHGLAECKAAPSDMANCLDAITGQLNILIMLLNSETIAAICIK